MFNTKFKYFLYTGLVACFSLFIGSITIGYFIEKHNYKIVDTPRECYIDGAWNKESEEDYLTEIQFLVE